MSKELKQKLYQIFLRDEQINKLVDGIPEKYLQEDESENEEEGEAEEEEIQAEAKAEETSEKELEDTPDRAHEKKQQHQLKVSMPSFKDALE